MMQILDFIIILKRKMKISHNWIKSYFSNGLMDKIISPIPSPEKLSDLINAYSFEVEGIERVGNDFVLDIDILPNRSSDCMCHYGIAKEVSAIINKPLNQSFFEDIADISEKKFNSAKVEVETKNCRRYALALFENIDNTAKTPRYIVERLSSLGQRSINPIVDITNYIMFELGSPMHAYDAKFLGDGVRVRMAEKDEPIKLLGGDEKVLSENDMVICDYRKNNVIGIAGVKGSEGSGASKDTRSIYLEVASFDANTIRHTSRRHDLHTEASSRFAQGPSDLIIPNVLERAISMIVDITGAKFSGVTYHKDSNDPLYYLGTNAKEVKRLLGIDISLGECKNILNRLHFRPEIIQNPRRSIMEYVKTLYGVTYANGASVTYDSPRAFDCSSLISHVFCRFGILCPRVSCNQFLYSDRINKEDVKPGDLVFSWSDAEGNVIHYKRKPEEFTYLIDGEMPTHGVSHVGIMDSDNYVIHCTGSKGKNCVVREKLEESPSFKNTVGFGRIVDIDTPHLVCKKPIERTDFKYPEDLIEEIGRIYGYGNIPTKVFGKSQGGVVQKRIAYQMKFLDILSDIGFIEVETRSFSGLGELEVLHPLAKDKKFLRSNLSTTLKSSATQNAHYVDLFGRRDIRLAEFGSVFRENGEFYNMALAISNPKEAKVISNDLKEKFEKIGIDLDVEFDGTMFEMDFDLFIQDLPEVTEYAWLDSYGNKQYKSFSQYPFVIRDISIFIKKGIEKEEIMQTIQKNAENFRRITLVDRFEKDSRVSLTFRIIFQSDSRTLTDMEVNGIMEEIEKELRNKGCEVR